MNKSGSDASLQITITGEPGCGKTTVARLVCAALQLDYLSTGSFQREIAAQMGLTTLELNQKAETDPSIDQTIDARTRALEDSNRSVLVDSRLAWHFLPRSLKVFLVCPPAVAAARVFDQNRNNESYRTKEDAIAALIARYDSEKARFAKYYGAQLANLRNYDLVIDTSLASPQAVAEVIVQMAREPASRRRQQAMVSAGSLRRLQLDGSARLGLLTSDESQDRALVIRAAGQWGLVRANQELEALGINTSEKPNLIACCLLAQDDEVIAPGMTPRSLMHLSAPR